MDWVQVKSLDQNFKLAQMCIRDLTWVTWLEFCLVESLTLSRIMTLCKNLLSSWSFFNGSSLIHLENESLSIVRIGFDGLRWSVKY